MSKRYIYKVVVKNGDKVRTVLSVRAIAEIRFYQTLVLSEIPAKGRRCVRDLLGRRGCMGGNERMSEKRTKEDLRVLQALPIDLKILKTKNRTY